MIKKTICVDFDGVLNKDNGYEEGNLGEPLSASKEFIKELRKKYKVVILTSRPKEQVINWLNNNGFPSMEVTNRKIPAVAYIDDRAIQFNGSYIQTIYEALNFKPYWMERYYRVYNVETGETKALFAEEYDAEMFAKDFKYNRVRIEILEGMLK
jgi:hydroxymethylpyrimidine pyrophosphatase-like HAD family hydrolase